MKKLFLILTLGLGLWTWDASGATYYVSTTGNNANTCVQAQSTSTPKRNISGTGGGISCLAAGDTLYIRAGTYTNGLADSIRNDVAGSGVPPSGTSWATATTVAAYPGETVILMPSGNDALIAFQQDPPQGRQYIIFDRLIIDALNIGGVYPVGIYLGTSSHHIRFQNGIVRNSGSFNLQGKASYIEILNSEIYNAGRGNCNAQQDPRCYGFYMNGHDMLFENLDVHDNADYGFQIYNQGDTTVSNNIVRNCKIHNNGRASTSSAGLLLASGNNNQAYNNVIYNNGFGGIQISCTGCPPAVFKIYNNTVYGNAQFGITDNTTGSLIKNNIFYSNGSMFPQTGTSTVYSNNLCQAAGTGCALTGNPLFVNTATFDFHIQSGSPAKDAGVTVSEVPADKDGVTRPKGPSYDIGAYEFFSPDSTPPTISAVGVFSFTDTSAIIKWTTNETADSQVEYGPTGTYGSSTTLDATLVTSHSVSVSGLSSNTLYHYRVKSKDASANLSTSGDFTFTTSTTPFTATIALIVPNGGERIMSSIPSSILWNSDDPGNLKIEYSANNGSIYSLVATGVDASNGIYTWTPPVGSNSLGLIKLTSLTDGAVSDTSAANFRISGNYVK